jgi:hypothetical protein
LINFVRIEVSFNLLSPLQTAKGGDRFRELRLDVPGNHSVIPIVRRIMKLSSSVALVVLAGCSDAHNPPTLWLALDGAEIHVTLIDHDPPPY